eukprot:GHVS01085863.1.p1 GENE.GHVS01085863.1~~GHVS01085863.1.p1  ORF type:complete len:840 (+),score=225.02 GHVS01085863.1:96-2615(+)
MTPSCRRLVCTIHRYYYCDTTCAQHHYNIKLTTTSTTTPVESWQRYSEGRHPFCSTVRNKRMGGWVSVTTTTASSSSGNTSTAACATTTASSSSNTSTTACATTTATNHTTTCALSDKQQQQRRAYHHQQQQRLSHHQQHQVSQQRRPYSISSSLQCSLPSVLPPPRTDVSSWQNILSTPPCSINKLVNNNSALVFYFLGSSSSRRTVSSSCSGRGDNGENNNEDGVVVKEKKKKLTSRDETNNNKTTTCSNDIITEHNDVDNHETTAATDSIVDNTTTTATTSSSSGIHDNTTTTATSSSGGIADNTTTATSSSTDNTTTSTATTSSTPTTSGIADNTTEDTTVAILTTNPIDNTTTLSTSPSYEISSYTTTSVQLPTTTAVLISAGPAAGGKGGMKPRELVEHLDKYVIGQPEAKRAIANALRNRWRRQQLSDPSLREDIVPKNILMIGPTGVGKTEIARRLSKVVDAPFVKVEATKFTEVGFHGRDVDQIIKDLMEVAMKQQKSKTESEYRAKAEETAEHSILETLLGKISSEDRQSWLGHLRMGLLDDRIIQVDVPVHLSNANQQAGNMLGSDAIDAIAEAVSSLSVKPFKVVQGRAGGVERKSLSVREAKQLLVQAQLDTLINQEMIVKKAVESAEQEGIVFVDEIDKICTRGHGGYTGPDASAEGVQRDLLPLIEGSTVSTKYGNVRTDYMLFVASGAFHSVKPSDMLAELQGRLPVRVELKPLTTSDFVSILKTPKHNLIRQNIEMLSTEGIELEFTDEAILEIAKVSSEVNTHVENIGARRLHTILEKIMEDINYDAPSMAAGSRVVVDVEKVRSTVVEYLKKTDLHKFIL